MTVLSSELKGVVKKVVEEDFEAELSEFDRDLPHLKSILFEIARVGKWDLAIWVEGTRVKELEDTERDLGLLERGNLVKGKLKYTERNAYREYQLTRKGTELVEKLRAETGQAQPNP